MARKKIEVKCPYCGNVYAASGMTAHVRARHTEKYEEFKANRAKIIAANTVGEEDGMQKPAPPDSGVLVTQEEQTPPPPPETPNKPPVVEKPAKEQPSGSFLGSVAKAFRDW